MNDQELDRLMGMSSHLIARAHDETLDIMARAVANGEYHLLEAGEEHLQTLGQLANCISKCSPQIGRDWLQRKLYEYEEEKRELLQKWDEAEEDQTRELGVYDDPDDWCPRRQ